MKTLHMIIATLPHSSYLAVRFLNLLMASVFSFTLYVPAATLVFVFALALVAKLQPYKHKRSNTVDIMLLVLMINVSLSSTMLYIGRFVYLKVLKGIVLVIFSLIILSYQIFLILACIWPKSIQCCKKCKTHLMNKIRMNGVNEGDRVLLNPESVDYNSCQ